MTLPDFKGFLPDGPVPMVFTWLRSALDCKSFVWDGDQAEAAESSLQSAEEWQAELLAAHADAQAEIARLRGALEGMVALYDTDEGCKSLPAVTTARELLK